MNLLVLKHLLLITNNTLLYHSVGWIIFRIIKGVRCIFSGSGRYPTSPRRANSKSHVAHSFEEILPFMSRPLNKTLSHSPQKLRVNSYYNPPNPPFLCTFFKTNLHNFFSLRLYILFLVLFVSFVVILFDCSQRPRCGYPLIDSTRTRGVFCFVLWRWLFWLLCCFL